MVKKHEKSVYKIKSLILLIFMITGIIIIRLFTLQIISYNHYSAEAAKSHEDSLSLDAHRGIIYIQDYASGEEIPITTNLSRDTLVANPNEIQNEELVAGAIASRIYDAEEAKIEEEERVKNALMKTATKEEHEKIQTLNDKELREKFYQNILKELKMKYFWTVTINQDPVSREIIPLDNQNLEQIKALNLPGVKIIDGEIRVNQEEVRNINIVASTLSGYLDMEALEIEKRLVRKRRRVELKKKLTPEVSAEIEKLMREDSKKKAGERNFKGLSLEEHYYRGYPEDELAANILGFVNSEGKGNYGIEQAYDLQLKGKTGKIKGQKDANGRFITVGESVIESAIDGDNIVLTNDRAMQKTIEAMLKKTVEEKDADSGQAIVYDPKTGKILVLAEYPTFNPNTPGKIADTEKINLSEEAVKKLIPIHGKKDHFWFYENEITNKKIEIIRTKMETNEYIYEKYQNTYGLEAYKNKAITESYEPGSIFKPLTMASALEDKTVVPTTTFSDPGYLEYEWKPGQPKRKITNVSEKDCKGQIDMTRILNYSCNTGISRVAEKLGRKLFHSYILKFGFGKKTGIGLDDESSGIVREPNTWADVDLYNHSFGQGISATPVQMASAFGVLANKGLLMEPHLVEKIISNEKTVKVEPKIIRQVISEETANTVTAMLVATAELNPTKAKKLPNHYIAIKTGTAQTLKGGTYVDGFGKVITSVAGYGPTDNPKFVLLVKLDRPRRGGANAYAEGTTTELFFDIAAYLYEHLGVPPDKIK